MNFKNCLYIWLAVFLVSGQLIASDQELSCNNWLKPSPLMRARSRLNSDLTQQTLAEELTRQDQQQEMPSLEKKKRGKAFIRSLIVPGAGERYVGKKTLGKAFLISEITLWLGYVAFRQYGKWIKDDAKTYAATHANAQINGKPSQFFVNIGIYNDIDQYNDAQQRMRQFDKVYQSEDYFWSWDSEENRRSFERMRISGDRALNRSMFVLGGIFANHIISAIDAVWQTYRYNKKLKQKEQTQLMFKIQYKAYPEAITINLLKPF